ncbi:hypothetical protein QJS04_geneDACA016414 [Acorus gramineus]|uniref:RNA-polymerase II-associated protein 3-like C-terminal domain-containing protein n=1 Tax=Acorus gramineus TaxID=55184 RepID=A0AAV8ZXF5_ACOGR|nr:hypothetical protein QJS04_geneDACA016414 [Acorus gramineus]
MKDFLDNLKDWEYSLNQKDRKSSGRARAAEKLVTSSQKMEKSSQEKGPLRKISPDVVTKQSGSYLRNLDTVSGLSTSTFDEEGVPDAASEKELGNEYFKHKKYKEAIDCYSRSIALSPTCVAFANRAMAYLKIRRFEEAESDCTEALNLDDRYVKAYSRRATARKELGKLQLSLEDSEFALRLEPNNQELKRLHIETKILYDKEMMGKIRVALKKETDKIYGMGDSDLKAKADIQGAHSVSSISGKTGVVEVKPGDENLLKNNGKALNKSSIIEEMHTRSAGTGNRNGNQRFDGTEKGAPSLYALNSKEVDRKLKMETSVQELASQVASRALTAAAKNITAPRSAYEFEVYWRGLSDDPASQARLLKTIDPASLPQLFKNALSAPMLVNIVKCVANFFMEEMDLAVSILDNLAKVARFDVITMCLSAADKADLHLIWNEVFDNTSIPMEHVEKLNRLQPRYCPRK